MTTRERFRIGLIVNPMAGRGGPAAHHGSDGLAWEEGASYAHDRAVQALRVLAASSAGFELLTAAGMMGETQAQAAGLSAGSIFPVEMPSTAETTRAAARRLAAEGVDLLLFAGGDGTARDVFAAIGTSVTILGIPAGVKMHSAVFALSPAAAGRIAAEVAGRPGLSKLAEVMDADEADRRRGHVSARLFGFARVPDQPRFLQAVKGARADDGTAALEALANRIARSAEEHVTYVLGPGTSMALVKKAFGVEGTLIGVDVIRNRQLIAENADRNTIDRLVGEAGRSVLIASPVGGQGFLFGRGNQQIGPWTLQRLRKSRIQVIAAREKLAALPQGSLYVDTGDPDIDRMLSGYWRVETGPQDSMMMPCRAAG